MKENCTEIVLRYREIARTVWNLGFWPDPELREVACLLAFEEAMARLFEGMVLLRVGSGTRLKSWPHGEGEPVKFRVSIDGLGANLRVDRYAPENHTHEWGSQVLAVKPGSCELRFRGFMDWDQLAPRDYRLLEVLVEQFDEHPEAVGHLALVELDKCSIWLHDEDNPQLNIDPADEPVQFPGSEVAETG